MLQAIGLLYTCQFSAHIYHIILVVHRVILPARHIRRLQQPINWIYRRTDSVI